MGGGVGSRFWPLSRETNPKQFIDLFGTGRSLIQMTFDRVRHFIPVKNIFVVTNEAYLQKVMVQLPELSEDQILLEPCRRNTAPAIAFASYLIRSINPKANILVAPSDHLILKGDDFVEAATYALSYAANHDELITLGIRPTRPETGYGYIQMGEPSGGEFIHVKTFTEKPNIEMAHIFLKSGEFLWNSGMFVWNVNAILKAFEELLPDVSTQLDNAHVYNTAEQDAFIADKFPRCPSISIDYGVLEKSERVLVLPVDFGWADLGSWGALYELGDKDEEQNVSIRTRAKFYEAQRNLVVLDDPNRVVVIQGISDCIIAESDNVLLICRQEDEQRIRHFVTDAAIDFGKEFS